MNPRFPLIRPLPLTPPTSNPTRSQNQSAPRRSPDAPAAPGSLIKACPTIPLARLASFAQRAAEKADQFATAVALEKLSPSPAQQHTPPFETPAFSEDPTPLSPPHPKPNPPPDSS